MPPKKPPRTVLAEDALAERIADERERKGWSPAGLASRLTAAGCPMTQSSVWRIENGSPRRRITFDEAVAFARVFEVELQELAYPLEVVRTDRATGLLRQLEQDDALRRELSARWEHHVNEVANLMRIDPTALVARGVNQQLGADGSEFDSDAWRRLTECERDVVVDRWLDTCVTDKELTIVPLNLSSDDMSWIQLNAQESTDGQHQEA